MAIFDIALAEAWAMRPDALENLLAIADRANEVTPEALEAYRAEHAKRGEQLRKRGNVTILDFAGPMFKKANLFQAMSGATSYQSIAYQLREALDAGSPIIGLFDTPGGTVAGCDELAADIFKARGTVPMIAVVSGQCCSAGFWLGTAFDEIVVSEASEVGSIGVILGLVDTKEADAKAGKRTIEFVSSKAPNKRPDYDTDEGRAVYQRRADQLGELFINTVARHRNVDPAIVAKDFGAGGVEIGQTAVDLKMADRIGSFEEVLADLQSRGTRRTTKPKGVRSMASETGATGDETTYTKADIDKAVSEAITAHETRRSAILDSEEGKANPKLAASLAARLSLSAADAIAILKDAGPAKTGAKDAADQFLADKENQSTVGFSEPAGDTPAKGHGWGEIVASHNKRAR